MTDIISLDATGQAALVADGQATADELLDAALDAAARWNPTLNALCHMDEDLARRMIADGLPDGPLRGVPVVLKDLGCETPDFPNSSGSRATPGTRFARHSETYLRLRRAGLVPFARTTTPEAGIGPVTEAAAYGGPTRNPWDPGRTPGGSSGGSGAAVAAGIVPAAHGSDGGGSLRMPASCCGLVTMKASRARIPDGPYAGEGWGGMAIEGVLTRSVRDQALLLDLLSGPDLGAPYHAPPLRGTFRDAAWRAPSRLRIGLCTTTFDGDPVQADCRRVVEHAARLLADLGHEIEEARPRADQRRMIAAWTRIVACGTESWVRALEAQDVAAVRDLLEPVAQGACRMAQTLTGADYLDAVNTIHAFGREMAAFFEDGPDILLTPTLAEPPARIGRFAHTRPEFADFERYRLGPEGVYSYSPFVVAFNASGQPAMSLPLGRTSGGLPVGVQIAAAMGKDELLISLAAQIEAAEPWADRRPPDPPAS